MVNMSGSGGGLGGDTTQLAQGIGQMLTAKKAAQAAQAGSAAMLGEASAQQKVQQQKLTFWAMPTSAHGSKSSITPAPGPAAKLRRSVPRSAPGPTLWHRAHCQQQGRRPPPVPTATDRRHRHPTQAHVEASERPRQVLGRKGRPFWRQGAAERNHDKPGS